MRNKVLLRLIYLSVFLFVSTNARLSINENTPYPPFDKDLYEQVLDPELCQRQISFMTANNSILLAQFLEAGIRFPRGFFEGNFVDLGNYYQCLGIDMPFEDSNIAGKYCMIEVPFDQDLNLPGLSRTKESIDISSLTFRAESQLKEYHAAMKGYRALSGTDLDDRSMPGNPLYSTVLRLALCIPRPCSTQEAISALLFNVSDIGFQYRDAFCRLPNDKQWVPADYVAVVIFSIIGLLTLLCTVYELTHIFVFKRDPKIANVYYRSFSVFNNTRRLLSFPEGADSLKCLDGIRTIATMWVIIGHSISTISFLLNPITFMTWIVTANALWITSAPITVDTFFVMTGILLVFTTAKKTNGMKLIRNIHLFYLNRLLRMFPLLAAAVLFDASVFHRVADGPHWESVANHTHRCRTFWWTTLLHLQNYLNPEEMCVPHSWYIAIDIQLHILSPLVLFWLLSGRRQIAWSALVATLAVAMGGSAIYNYFMEFPAHTVTIRRNHELLHYMTKYYFHIMSRITPFLVGMVFGYVLHLWRGKKVQINMIIVLISWSIALGIMSLTLYMLYRVKQYEWDNQTVDTMLNTLMRPLWAAAVGWMVLACSHGYGGPIHWFLSLSVWQLPSRLCYGMYLFHYPIMFIAYGAKLSPELFSVSYVIFQSMSFLMLSFLASFVATVSIDAPLTILFKRLLDRGHTVQQKPKPLEEFKAN